MALERTGLGAILTLDNRQFVQASSQARNSLGQFTAAGNRVPPVMNRMAMSINRAAQQMRSAAGQMKMGMGQLAGGLRNAALGMTPLTLAVGAGIKKAADFEKQMSAVGSITRASETDMAALTKKAKQMGIESVFSATQSGEAMEYMARAGANTTQIIAGLQGVMDAAAADSIDLATSADIVAQVVKGMGQEWEQAGHIADVLALTSARANTNIIGLGESFKYGVSQARSMGVSLEETSALFGKMADAGLKGSLGGTAFTNMLIKLSKPTAKAQKMITDFGISLNNSDGSLRKISSIVDEFKKHIDKLPSATEKARYASEIFGIRGARAYNALAAAGKESIDKLHDELMAASDGIGAASEMAKKRLDNFLGAITLFGASVESVSIGLFDPLLKAFTPVVQQATDGLNSVLFSLEGLKEIRNAENAENAKSATLIAQETSKRLQNAGVMEKQADATKRQITLLSRLRMSEQELSREQLDARRRTLQQSLDAMTKAQAARLKLNEDEVKKRTAINAKLVEQAIKQDESGEFARRQIQKRILQDALDGSKKLSAAQKKAALEEIDQMVQLESAAASRADGVRAQIISIEKMQEIEQEYGPAAVAIAQGIQDAIDDLRDAWDGLIGKVKLAAEWLRKKLGDDGLRKLTKIVIIVGVIAAAIAPLILGLMLFGFAISGITTAISGLATIAGAVFGFIQGAIALVAAAFWPIVIAVGIVALAFALIRREGESFGETWDRIKFNIIKAVLDAKQAVMRVWDGFKQRWNEVSDGIVNKWNETWERAKALLESVTQTIRTEFMAIFGDWFAGTDEMETDWESWGTKIADVVAWVAGTAIDLFGGIVEVVANVMLWVWDLVRGPMEAVKNAIDVIIERWGEVKQTFLNVWGAISETFSEVMADLKAELGSAMEAFNFGASNAQTDWVEMGKNIGHFIVDVLKDIIEVVGFVVSIFIKAAGIILSALGPAIRTIGNMFRLVFGGVVDILQGNVLQGIKKIGVALFDNLTLPIRMALKMIMKLAEKIPGVKSKIPEGLRKFVDEGLTGFTFPKPEKEQRRTVKVAEKGAEKLAKERKNQPEVATAEANQKSRLEQLKKQVEGIGDLKAQQAAAAKEPPSIKINQELKDKRSVEINQTVQVGDDCISRSRQRVKTELAERAGFKTQRWQARMAAEQGAVPMKRTG